MPWLRLASCRRVLIGFSSIICTCVSLSRSGPGAFFLPRTHFKYKFHGWVIDYVHNRPTSPTIKVYRLKRIQIHTCMHALHCIQHALLL